MYPETALFPYHVACPYKCPARKPGKTNMLLIILLKGPTQLCALILPCFHTMGHAMFSYHVACPKLSPQASRKKLICY